MPHKARWSSSSRSEFNTYWEQNSFERSSSARICGLGQFSAPEIDVEVAPGRSCLEILPSVGLWPDVSTAGEYFVPPPAVSNLSFYPSFDYYESLASVTQANPYALSGQYLEDLQDARQVLREAATYVFNIHQWLAGVRSEAEFTKPVAPRQFTYEAVVKIFNSPPRASRIQLWVGILRYLQRGPNNLFRRVSHRLRAAKLAINQTRPRFCGQDWSRRLSSLLHGSHPPKTEISPIASQSVGCA